MRRVALILLTATLTLGGAVACSDDGDGDEASSDTGAEATNADDSGTSTAVSDQLDEFCDAGEEYLSLLESLADPDNPTPEEQAELDAIGGPAVDTMNSINASGELPAEDQQRLDDCLRYFDGERP